MRTIGKHYPRNAPYGDYPAVDDYSGVPHFRSKLERDQSGLLRKRRRRRERDKTELATLEAENAANIEHEVPEHDGNGEPFEVETPTQLKATLPYTNFWGD